MTARLLNCLFGAWLFCSVFMWPHGAAQRWNALLCGIFIVVFASVALKATPKLRFVNTALGAWLVFSTFVLPSQGRDTIWNHLVVGLLVFILSFFSGKYDPMTPGEPGPP